MLPTVVNYALSSTFGTTAIAKAQGSTSGLIALNGTYGTASPLSSLNSAVISNQQQRITVTSGSSDTGIYFHVVGLNQAGFTISEYFAGAAAGLTVQSNLDYQTVISVQPSASSVAQTLATTANTVSVGINTTGSTPWFIVNTHVSPSNIQYGTVLQTGAATWSIQYTYDDPNNPPAGQSYAQPFNHPTIVNVTASIDGSSNDPLFAWRLLISAGTGTVRAVGIQAGIGGP